MAETDSGTGAPTSNEATSEGVEKQELMFGSISSSDADVPLENSAELDPPSLSPDVSKEKIETEIGTINIMVAGKPKNGKSTALNNIFGLSLETKASPLSGTQDITITETGRGNTLLRIIDTPGLGSAEAPKERITVQMAKATKDMDFTFFYCLSINPSSMLTEVDKLIVLNLIEILGQNIWKKCILLLTFSDNACSEFDSESDYVNFVKEHAKEFQTLLRKNGHKKCSVKTIFDYKTDEKLELQEKVADIVAIPVMKFKTSQKFNILPGMLQDTQDWTDLVLIELLKKTPEHQIKFLLSFKYSLNQLPDNYFIKGALLGGVVGQVAGMVGGPVLSAVGTGVGAGVGAIIGGVAHLGVALKNRNKQVDIAACTNQKEQDQHLEDDLKKIKEIVHCGSQGEQGKGSKET